MDVPVVVEVVALLEGGEEEVPSSDGEGLVPIGAAGGDEGGKGGECKVLDGARRVEEEPQEGRRVGLTEVTTEGRGGGHRAASPAAGEVDSNESGKGEEAEEDLEQDVICEGGDGGGTRFLLAFHRWRRMGPRSVSRHCGGEGGDDSPFGRFSRPPAVQTFTILFFKKTNFYYSLVFSCHERGRRGLKFKNATDWT